MRGNKRCLTVKLFNRWVKSSLEFGDGLSGRYFILTDTLLQLNAQDLGYKVVHKMKRSRFSGLCATYLGSGGRRGGWMQIDEVAVQFWFIWTQASQQQAYSHDHCGVLAGLSTSSPVWLCASISASLSVFKKKRKSISVYFGLFISSWVRFVSSAQLLSAWCPLILLELLMACSRVVFLSSTRPLFLPLCVCRL